MDGKETYREATGTSKGGDMLKRFAAFFMSFVLVIGLMPGLSFAAEAEETAAADSQVSSFEEAASVSIFIYDET